MSEKNPVETPVRDAPVARGQLVVSGVGQQVDKAEGSAQEAKEVVPGAREQVPGKTESAIDKVLRQRYEKRGAEKSVKEALQERYTPIGKRDNTTLRGL